MAEEKWSMTVPDAVTVEMGETAILPCSFTSPTKLPAIITVIWRITSDEQRSEIFKCISKASKTESGQNCSESIGRYSLNGDPNTCNFSLIIQKAWFTDEKKYFCRVVLTIGSYETKSGTRLNIQGNPYIYVATQINSLIYLNRNITNH